MSDALIARLKARLPGVDMAMRPVTPCPPASTEGLETAEATLGFPIPSLLRRVYAEVANGGFGPGYGIMGVGDGYTNDLEQTVETAYSSYQEAGPGAEDWYWPRGLMPICDFGCAIAACYDALAADGRVLYFDPNALEPEDPPENGLFLTGMTLEEWLDHWAQGGNAWDIFYERNAASGMSPLLESWRDR